MKLAGSNDIGNGSLQFYHPRGIKVHSNTRLIFIANSENQCVQVLNSNLSQATPIVLEGIIINGSAPNQFSRPMDMAFDKD